MIENNDLKNKVEKIRRQLLVISAVLGMVGSVLTYALVDPSFSAFRSKTPTFVPVDEDRIENGLHVRTGLVDAPGLMVVVNNCTNCHSSKLVTQNRMKAEAWATTIDWMQETQNLWQLGDNEKIIIDYLVANYPPQKKGRRQALKNIEWYELEN